MVTFLRKVYLPAPGGSARIQDATAELIQSVNDPTRHPPDDSSNIVAGHSILLHLPSSKPIPPTSHQRFPHRLLPRHSLPYCLNKSVDNDSSIHSPDTTYI